MRAPALSCPYTWVDGLTSDGISPGIDCRSTVSGCELDYTTGTQKVGAFPTSPWSSRWLFISNTTGFYGYDTNNATQTNLKGKLQ